MWNLKKKTKTNEQTEQNRNRAIDTENKDGIARSEGCWERREIADGD